MKQTLIARLLGLGRRAASAGRVALARAGGAKIGTRCVVGSGADIILGVQRARAGSIAMGHGCELAQGVVFHPYGGTIELGDRVYVGQHTVIFGHGGVTVGDDTLIAMHCRIISANHAIPGPELPVNSQSDEAAPVRIGRDVWLGAGVSVLAGVTIGDGCVVGAGAVVTKDLPPYSICVGVPAKAVGHRANTAGG